VPNARSAKDHGTPLKVGNCATGAVPRPLLRLAKTMMSEVGVMLYNRRSPRRLDPSQRARRIL
jgi:hypothetical protein